MVTRAMQYVNGGARLRTFFIAVACCLWAVIVSGCASDAASGLPSVTTSAALDRIDHDVAQPKERAIGITAGLLATGFDESAMWREAYGGRFLSVTGAIVRKGSSDSDMGGLLLELEGTQDSSVLCELPKGLNERRVTNRPLPSGGLLVLVAGRVSETRSQGDIVLVDCTVLKTGPEVLRSIARIPGITNILQGWGLFWAWLLFAGVGYLLAFRRRRATSTWLHAVFVLSHTGAMAVLYACLGSLVLPHFDVGGTGDLATWPWLLLLYPS